ncbi:P-loop containing nucleoside triphosphate hydrolase protein, partial [Dothidotthia symphoricarpi CBS 119687]
EDGSSHQAELASDLPTQRNIEFKSLVAAHSLGMEPVIMGISFSIKQSEHVALCGGSGCGNTEVRSPLTESMSLPCRAMMSVPTSIVVPQDPLLVPGMTRFSIEPFAKISDEDIFLALERVRLWVIISEQGGLSKDMDLTTWSVGQKQLLCFAQAIFRNCKVSILDEATSIVDDEAETSMQNSIDTTFKDCTVLAVMHRLTHITRYDKVALLDHGHFMGFDSPETSLAQGLRFLRLYRTSATQP